MPLSLSRRGFLKAGLAGTLVLAGSGAAYRFLSPSATPARFILDQQAQVALAAIVPVILNGAIEPAHISDAVDRVRHAIGNLPLTTQKEIQDLFAMLTLAPARRFVVGISQDWSEAPPEEVAAFLQRWRLSRFALLQSAYHALHDLVTGSWYADESTWAAIGYPGPMKELS